MEFRLQWKTLELLEFGICVIGKQIFMDKFNFIILFFMFINYDDDTLRLKFYLLIISSWSIRYWPNNKSRMYLLENTGELFFLFIGLWCFVCFLFIFHNVFIFIL